MKIFLPNPINKQRKENKGCLKDVSKGVFTLFLPVSMDDCIESQSIPPAASEVSDSDSRISFCCPLSPSKKSFTECDAVIMLYDVRNLNKTRQCMSQVPSKEYQLRKLIEFHKIGQQQQVLLFAVSVILSS